MTCLAQLDWNGMFVPSQPVLETVIRGTCMYLALFAMLRVFRRQTGALGPADLLVLLLIADAAQNGMADDYKSITDGLILVATIVFWEYAIDWLSYKSPVCRKILEREPRVLIEEGSLHKDNLHSELMTDEELLSQLRQKGFDDPESVKLSMLEPDGHVSVVSHTEPQPQQHTKAQHAAM